ncbi:MAG: glycosyltransferase [Nitrospina sp.]|nr:glycosyltransferase [Nitrospina sp.]
MQNTLISIVIRAKNEEKWINSCLFAVHCQDYPNFEIILVDNDSTDRTLEYAEKYACKVVTISDEDFNFSRSLNWGIKATSGDLIAILSGHCIPVNDQWLSRMVMNFNDPNVVAVYGKQEPLPDSSSFDKRDLWTTFGLDRKIQKRDFFFHNANSMIRKNVWEEVSFSEDIHGVEDRDWAKKVLRNGSLIVYEPTARVFHHHGLHHNQSEARANRVVRMIELINKDLT